MMIKKRKRNKNATNKVNFNAKKASLITYVYIASSIFCVSLVVFLWININVFIKQIKVTEIEIQGVGSNVKDYLYGNIKSILGMNILEVNLIQLANFIRSEPIVYNANVKRLLNGKIIVNVIERNPYFLWKSDDDVYKVVDSKNQVVSHKLKFSLDNLIIIEQGEYALKRFDSLRLLIYRDPKILNNIKKLVFNGYRWDIWLKNGIQIKLPENNMESAYYLLIQYNKKYKLIDRKIKSIDVTIPNKLYIIKE